MRLQRGANEALLAKWAADPRVADGKVCPGCGERFYRHPLEQPHDFLRRPNCSVACGNVAKGKASAAAHARNRANIDRVRKFSYPPGYRYQNCTPEELRGQP